MNATHHANDRSGPSSTPTKAEAPDSRLLALALEDGRVRYMTNSIRALGDVGPMMSWDSVSRVLCHEHSAVLGTSGRLLLRGIAASVGGEVICQHPKMELSADMAKFREACFGSVQPPPIRIKPIAEVLASGTELSNNGNITLAQSYRPASDDYPQHVLSYMQNACFGLRSIAPEDLRSHIFPAIVVYNPEVTRSLGGYQIELPSSEELRRQSIIAVYLFDFSPDGVRG